MLIDNCKEIAALWRKNAVTSRKMMVSYSAQSRAFHVYQEKAATLEQCAYLLETAVKNEENLK